MDQQIQIPHMGQQIQHMDQQIQIPHMDQQVQHMDQQIQQDLALMPHAPPCSPVLLGLGGGPPIWGGGTVWLALQPW